MDTVNSLISTCFPNTKFSLYLFGSRRLGVEDKDSDTDLVCLMVHTNFFEEFGKFLESKEIKSEIVKEARIPLISFKMEGETIQLLHANDLKDKSMLGYLNTEELLKRIEGPDPEGDRLTIFRNVLVYTRKWAKEREIYSNAMGYLCGCSLSLLVLRAMDNTTGSPTEEKTLLNFFKNTDWKINTLVEPVRNTLSKATKSTLRLIEGEFNFQAKSLESSKLAASVHTPFLSRYKNYIRIRSDQLWIKYHIRAFSQRVEGDNIYVYPYINEAKEGDNYDFYLAVETVGKCELNLTPALSFLQTIKGPSKTVKISVKHIKK